MLARLNNKCLEHCGLAKFHTGSTLMSRKKNHYDVLGLSSKATKSQIKKSYYELSLKFHPDQNKGDEKAANKFREITEAYEILGNATKKRLYDQGLYGMGSSSAAASDPPLSRHKQYVKHVKHKVPATGRTEAYNFDAWTKAHYSETFQRKQRETFDRKEREKVMEEIRERNKKSHNEENDRLVLFMGLVTLFVGILYATASVETKTKDKPR